MAVLLLAAVSSALASPSSNPFDKPAPYVVITTSGHRIDALAKPERRDGRAFIRLSPNGQLTALPEGAVDWAATERFNAQAPKPAAQAAPARESAPDLAAAGPGEPVELKIIGSKAGPVSSEPAAGEGSPEGDEGPPEGEGTGTDDASGSPPPGDSAAKAAELTEIRKQLTAAQAAREEAGRRVPALEARLEELQQKVALEPRSSPDEQYESPSRKALRDVQAQLDGARKQIDALDRRLGELRVRQQDLELAGD